MTRTTGNTSGDTPAAAGRGRTGLVVVAWAWVLIPFVYGVIMLVLKLPALF